MPTRTLGFKSLKASGKGNSLHFPSVAVCGQSSVKFQELCRLLLENFALAPDVVSFTGVCMLLARSDGDSYRPLVQEVLYSYEAAQGHVAVSH